MKVKYAKEGYGHKVGTVINVDTQLGKKLIDREICEKYTSAPAVDLVAEQTAKALEVLKSTEVASIEYGAMKQIVSALSIDTPDQKKATLIEALTAYKATLEA